MPVNQLPRVVDLPHSARFAPSPEITTIPGDGALSVDVDGVYLLTKGSAAAITVAAPGAKNIGRRITILTGSDFAHVVTFTGGTLRDGTTGASTTYTAAAFQGCSLTVQAVSATTWNVVAQNLGAIA
jgi:hypothetical protein